VVVAVLIPFAVLAVVAVVAFPVREAVMVPAEKLLDPSLLTIALAVLAEVAALPRTAAAPTFAPVWPPTEDTTVAPDVPVTSPTNAPEIAAADVAVVALPVSVAVMVPAEKLPEPSRWTRVEGVLAEVAVCARVVDVAI
jgi:hypothetical protein